MSEYHNQYHIHHRLLLLLPKHSVIRKCFYILVTFSAILRLGRDKPVVWIPTRACEKLPVTWCWAVFFTGYSGFLHHLQLASHDLAANMAENVTKYRNRKSKFQNKNPNLANQTEKWQKSKFPPKNPLMAKKVTKIKIPKKSKYGRKSDHNWNSKKKNEFPPGGYFTLPVPGLSWSPIRRSPGRWPERACSVPRWSSPPSVTPAPPRYIWTPSRKNNMNDSRTSQRRWRRTHTLLSAVSCWMGDQLGISFLNFSFSNFIFKIF